ncbi:MAG TPA: MaoC family dehydratase N-terminal domain-containing protein [Actinomycetes bacterium]|nr:MaoC family dehydratase N-terminal domain-containing protein [Actinomycetes bacterium]
MPLDPAFVGRSYPAAGTYLVGREKVREFATAIGERHPYCHDVEAARAGGYADVVAPVTFAIAVSAQSLAEVFADRELGLDFSRVVHGDQSFAYARPLVAGDEIRVTTTIDSIRSVAGNEVLGLSTELVTVAGEAVCRTSATMVVRGPEAS